MAPCSLVKYVSAFGQKKVQPPFFTEARRFVTTHQIIRCQTQEAQNQKHLEIIRYQIKNELKYLNTIEFRLSGHCLPGTPFIHIGLALRVNLSRILQD